MSDRRWGGGGGHVTSLAPRGDAAVLASRLVLFIPSLTRFPRLDPARRAFSAPVCELAGAINCELRRGKLARLPTCDGRRLPESASVTSRPIRDEAVEIRALPRPPPRRSAASTADRAGGRAGTDGGGGGGGADEGGLWARACRSWWRQKPRVQFR